MQRFLTVLAALVFAFAALPASAQSVERVQVNRAETYIPDLMQIDWVEHRASGTVIQFRFLRGYCGANLNAPGTAGAFRIVDTRNRQRAPFEVQRTEGAFATFGPAPCGNAGDTFRLTFAPLPADVTHVNITEGDGGYRGSWSWYNIQVR